jgi:DNA repair protein RecO (recombination protein O)
MAYDEQMATYSVHAVNLNTYSLGETDKIVTMFSAERGLIRAVAKGARRPGAKIGGRSEPLNINRYLLAKGRNLDIITQAESIGSFPRLRHDLTRLSFALYFAELTQSFGQGLSEESAAFFEYLGLSLSRIADSDEDPVLLSLEFELHLLGQLGYKPELTICIACAEPMTEYRLAIFHHDSGGLVCSDCHRGKNQNSVQEYFSFEYGEGAQSNAVLQERKYKPYAGHVTTHITPLVWKRLVMMSSGLRHDESQTNVSESLTRANQAARRLIQTYLEHRSSRRMKALDLIDV